MCCILWHFQRVRTFRLTDVAKTTFKIHNRYFDHLRKTKYPSRTLYLNDESKNRLLECTQDKLPLLRSRHRTNVQYRQIHVSQPLCALNPIVLWAVPKAFTLCVAILGHRIYLARNITGIKGRLKYLKLMRLLTLFLVPLALFILLFYATHFEKVPITNRRRFIAFSHQDMVEMTSLEMRLIDYEFGKFFLNTSDPTFRRVRRVVSKILQSNQDIEQIRSREWNLIVIDLPEVKNAFILPNGNMYIFTGILNVCRNDDEIGFVVAHELSHAVVEHLAEQMSHMYLGEFLFLFPAFLIWSFLPTLGALATHIIARHFADAVFNLPFSRFSEIEADMIGIQLASKACFDPRQAMAFWKKMMVSNDESVPWRYRIEWLSTHPSYETRARYLEKMLPKALAVRSEFKCPPLSDK